MLQASVSGSRESLGVHGGASGLCVQGPGGLAVGGACYGIGEPSSRGSLKTLGWGPVRGAVAGDTTLASRAILEAGVGGAERATFGVSWVLSCCINAPGFQILRTPFSEELFKFLWFKI